MYAQGGLVNQIIFIQKSASYISNKMYLAKLTIILILNEGRKDY